MAYVLIQNGVVIQKSFRARPGFIEVDDSVVCGQLDSGGGVFVNPLPTPEEIAATNEAIRLNQEALEVRADNKFQAFITKTPTQVKSWTKNSFPSLTLAEQNDLATLVQAICILGRRL